MTLYRETPCEHGRVERHAGIWPDNLDKFPTGICPGGSREEVTIDYEMATRRAIDAATQSHPQQTPRRDSEEILSESELRALWVGVPVAIDTALDITAEKESASTV